MREYAEFQYIELSNDERTNLLLNIKFRNIVISHRTKQEIVNYVPASREESVVKEGQGRESREIAVIDK